MTSLPGKIPGVMLPSGGGRVGGGGGGGGGGVVFSL